MNDSKQTQVNSIRKQAPVVGFLKQHPLWSYFLLVFGLAWLQESLIYGLINYQGYVLFAVIFSPTAIGLVMTSISEGSLGISRLFDRCTRWRVSFAWYLLALLFTPALFFLTILSIPGAATAFQIPSLSFIWTYLSALALGIFRAPIREELGWRGFALPRLQEKFGPLFGTLILGSLWALWHLPKFLTPREGVLGVGLLAISAPFLKYAGSILGSAIIYTWIFNRSNGSILLSMLFHASINVTFSIFPNAFLPSLFPPDTVTQLFSKIGFLPLAILVIILTRGRLGYDQYSQTKSA
jgi:membrane protease YdiL (CAAX protease family)